MDTIHSLHDRERLSALLDRLFSSEQQDSTLGHLVAELDHHGLAMILILFSIPAALPIPAAGYSTMLSIPLMCIGVHFLIGKEKLWLPKRISDKPFSPSKFQKLRALMSRLVRTIETFSKPRLGSIIQSRVSHFSLGLLTCLLALFMAIPIPGTNTLPAGGIFLIGFGLLEDDGLLVLLGVIYSLLAIALGCVILYFGYEGYEIVKAAIRDFLT